MAAIDLNDFDKSVKPTDDFFRYVNGGWLAKNPIPADESRWGSFNVLRRDVDEQLKIILEEIAAKNDLAPGSDEQKIRDFYLSAMDVQSRNRLGTSPLSEMFHNIAAIADADDLAMIVGELHRVGIGVFWAAFAGQDEKKSDVMAFQIWQGGLGLPDRDYYLKDDEKSKKIRADYLAYMHDMIARTNLEKDVSAAVASVIKIETRLAQASLDRVDLRDVEKMYNKIALPELAALAPKISFAKYFGSIGIDAPGYAIVGQPKFLGEISQIFSEIPLDELKIYLRWHLLNDMASYLSEDLERRNFDFYGRTFTGTTEMKPLWRRALRQTNDSLDELLGKAYVARHFSEDAKMKIKDLVEHLVVAYRARIERLEWMGAETKKKAFEKLGTVTRKLGYPDIWKDYSPLTIGPDSYVQNVMRAYTFEFDRKMKEVGGPVNRAEWLMSPQTVNAYYMPPMNDIVFPAAILQPPFFDPSADDAFNFGGIGSVIGHELTHGFDDQGSRFDANGNLNEWWTAEDKKQFDASAAHLAEQFDGYEPLPGLHVNGKLTLGENIADLGGLLVAYDGLKLKMAEQNSMSPSRNEFTAEQNFFIGYALTERNQTREEAMRLQIQTDPHSPSEFRVNGPSSNMTEFYEAFGAKPGDKLYREPGDRVRIW